MKVSLRCDGFPAASTRRFLLYCSEYEYNCYDPKDGELCLSRVKSGETQMEARSDTDVQIVRRT